LLSRGFPLRSLILGCFQAEQDLTVVGIGIRVLICFLVQDWIEFTILIDF